MTEQQEFARAIIRHSCGHEESHNLTIRKRERKSLIGHYERELCCSCRGWEPNVRAQTREWLDLGRERGETAPTSVLVRMLSDWFQSLVSGGRHYPPPREFSDRANALAPKGDTFNVELERVLYELLDGSIPAPPAPEPPYVWRPSEKPSGEIIADGLRTVPGFWLKHVAEWPDKDRREARAVVTEWEDEEERTIVLSLLDVADRRAAEQPESQPAA